MKSYFTLGLSLCFLSFLSGCCCCGGGGMHGCGFRRMRGCNPCGGGFSAGISSYGPVAAPFGGGCNSCNSGMDAGVYGGAGAPVYGQPGIGAPVYGQPGAFYQPYGIETAGMNSEMPVNTASLPNGTQGYNSGMMMPEQSAGSPISATALARPESLATY